MREQIDNVIAKLEKIPVSGINAILMGEALKELIQLREGEQNADNITGNEPDADDNESDARQ